VARMVNPERALVYGRMTTLQSSHCHPREEAERSSGIFNEERTLEHADNALTPRLSARRTAAHPGIRPTPG